MQLLVSDIRAQHTLEESAELDPRMLRGESRDQVQFDWPVSVTVQAQMTETNIVVLGRVSTQAQFNCARCLAEFKAPVKGTFQDLFSFDQEKIELTDMIRESIWVNVPLRGLCKESCLGLCPACGVNKNATACNCALKTPDKRWTGLGKLRFK